MAGAGSSSKPLYAYTSRGTKSTTLTGDRLYLSATFPGGNPVNGGAAWRTNPCGARVAYQSCAWPNTVGYQSYENTVAHASIVHQVNYTDPSSAYPGRWWFYAKSIVMDKNANGGYTVSGVKLPTTPALGGWSPS